MPGGFHPFHPGHLDLYQKALEAFPGADVYVAASNDTSKRPFPFAIKEKLAQLAGVAPGHFVQVKSPFGPEEITSKYDPETTQLIFVKSDKNSKTGPNPEGPFPAEPDPKTGKLPLVTRGPRKGLPVSDRLQYYHKDQPMAPMSRHAYLAYLPAKEFGGGMTSGSEMRKEWPTLDDQGKIDRVMTLYPQTQGNKRLASTVVRMLDTAIPPSEVAEATLVNDPERGVEIRPDGGLGSYTPDTLKRTVEQHIIRALEHLKNGDFEKVDYMLYQWGVLQSKVDALRKYADFMQQQGRRPIARGREVDLGEDYVEETWSNKYKKSINCSNPKGFSQKAHCAARRKRAAGGKTKSKPVR